MLFLASRSPRRRELLARLGVPFRVLDVDVPEVQAVDESAQDYVCRVAADKATAGWLLAGGAPGMLVIGADTEVVLDGQVLGKPVDDAAAAGMLQRLAGREHEVLTAVVLIGPDGSRQVLSRSRLRFAPLSVTEIAAYVRSGEPAGKAGGYAIQGAAESFVQSFSGSYSGVMGLPLFETSGLLRAAGMPPVFAAGQAAAAVAEE